MQNRLLFEPKSMLPQVKPEGTYWRDLILLSRHRDWGWDVPATDIDFLEYDHGEPVALVEYKMIKDLDFAKVPNGDANLRALISLANKAHIPLLIAFYNSTRKWFRIMGITYLAKQIVDDTGTITEFKFVELLYRIRHREMPEDVKNKLNGGGY